MKTTVSSKGKIIIPAEIRGEDGIEEARPEPPANEGLVDWLLACPEKGFFVPIGSESTDEL
jgi:hypothetical protein